MCLLEFYTQGTAILALQCNVNEKNHLGEQGIVSGAALLDYGLLMYLRI